MFHKEVVAYSNGLIKRLAARFDKDLNVYSDSQIRKLICMHDEGLVQYASELLQMFNKDMKVYTDDLVDRLSSIFNKEIGEYSHDLQHEICIVFNEEKKTLHNEIHVPMSDCLFDADKKADLCPADLQFEADESKPGRHEGDMVQKEAYMSTPTEGTRKHKKNRFKKMSDGLKKLVVCGLCGTT